MPRRIGSPFMFGQAVLEPIVQPIYDDVVQAALAAAGATNRFFTVVAAKNEVDIFPGITGGGQFSAPRLAVIYSHRLVFSEAVAVDANILPDLKILLYNSFYRFHVGVKDYLVVPSFLVPAGAGISGFAATTVGATSFQTAQNGVPAFHSHLSIEKRKVAIPPQQQFYSDWVIDPVTTASARTVWAVMDAEYGQEVQ